MHAVALNTFAKDCHARSVAAGWYHNPHTGEKLSRNVPEMLCLIHSEISEGMEGYRKNKMDDKLPDRKMIEVELADALIRIGDLAAFLDLDLGGAVDSKMAFNATRSDHTLEARRANGGKQF
jgi:NTP pyrophosphatase (non-canonical NTP hydrolase)